MDPIQDIKFAKDTSLALLLAAKARGHRLWYMEQRHLFLDQGVARAAMARLEVFDNPQSWYALTQPEDRNLADLDVILMRKDPPFDDQYIQSTYMLERAAEQGTLVVNRPQSLRDCNEKVYATAFPQCCPPVIVSRDSARLRQFHTLHRDVIFKPLEGMGGDGIFHCKAGDSNVSVILETLTHHGKRFIMAQKYLPEIKAGDKRVLVIDGEPVPYALARIPASGESRGNLAAGGAGVAQALSERDRWIVSQVAPDLKKRGLLFVGLDIIGDYLTEINVTSPTCAREIDAAFDTNIGGRLIDVIEAKIRQQ